MRLKVGMRFRLIILVTKLWGEELDREFYFMLWDGRF